MDTDAKCSPLDRVADEIREARARALAKRRPDLQPAVLVLDWTEVNAIDALIRERAKEKR